MINIFDVMLQMIELAKQQQAIIRPHIDNMSSRQWINEFCTIKLGGPRGSGHTYAMTSLPRCYPTDRFLLTTNISKHLPNISRAAASDAKNVWAVSTRNPRWEISLLGLPPFQCIIMDTCGQTPNAEIERMLKLAECWIRPGDPFYFILLG